MISQTVASWEIIICVTKFYTPKKPAGIYNLKCLSEGIVLVILFLCMLWVYLLSVPYSS